MNSQKQPDDWEEGREGTHGWCGHYRPLKPGFRPTGGYTHEFKVPQQEFLGLKPIGDEDHPWLVSLHNDPLVLRNLTDPTPITIDSHMKWWESIKGNTKQLRFIFTVNGIPAGLTKFYDIDDNNGCCMLGADLHKDFREKGLAKPMWRLMLGLCFESMKLHRVSLTTAQFNIPAQRVYSGLGFKEEGRLVQSLFRDGQYYDQVLMYLLRSDWSPVVKP